MSRRFHRRRRDHVRKRETPLQTKEWEISGSQRRRRPAIISGWDDKPWSRFSVAAEKQRFFLSAALFYSCFYFVSNEVSIWPGQYATGCLSCDRELLPWYIHVSFRWNLVQHLCLLLLFNISEIFLQQQNILASMLTIRFLLYLQVQLQLSLHINLKKSG